MNIATSRHAGYRTISGRCSWVGSASASTAGAGASATNTISGTTLARIGAGGQGEIEFQAAVPAVVDQVNSRVDLAMPDRSGMEVLQEMGLR